MIDLNDTVVEIPGDDEEVFLSDDQGPLAWYRGCGSHEMAISQRLARMLENYKTPQEIQLMVELATEDGYAAGLVAAYEGEL